MAYNHGREERKWRLWKEAEEKQLRSLGVSENDIEKAPYSRLGDFQFRQAFLSAYAGNRYIP